MNRVSSPGRWLGAVCAALVLSSAPAAAQTEVVLNARDTAAFSGDWQAPLDSSTAAGRRLWNPDRGAAKLSSALASPHDYVDLLFTAEAGRGYRLWIRGKADNDSWSNDSLFVQFSGSLNASGQAVYRIGTASATPVSIEACKGCGVSGWGWADNGYDSLGPLIYFATTGTQRIRIQRREDGISVDQIVLSASRYLTSAPGSASNDSTIVGSSSSGSTPSSPAPAPTTSVSAPSSSGTIALRDSSATTLRGGAYADRNFSGDATLETRVSGDPTYSRNIVMKFDTQNNIPAGATITSAYLVLTVAGGNSETRTLNLFRVPSSYEEGEASWNRRNSSTSWGRAGGELAELHNARRVSATPGSKVTFEVAALVQGAVRGDYGSSRYTRVLIMDDGGASRDGYKQYYSDEAGNESVRPVLMVTYASDAAPAPAPAPTPAPTPAPAPAPEPTPEPSGSGVRLRVLQWNIHHGVGTDGAYDIDRIATWIARSSPDVVLLNEVEKYTSWGNEDQPARFKALLEAKTGRTWYMHFAQEFGQWWSNGKGHLMLSTYPFDGVSQTTITQSSGLRGAGAASQATIYVNGRAVNFILSHLDPYDRDMRLVQARDVIRWAAGFAENRILAGDMNAWPDQSSILELNKTYHDSWTVAANKGAATGISGISPFGATKNGRIDYLFFSKNAPNLVVIDSRTPDTRDSRGVMPADHRPVVTTFEVW